MKLKLLFLLTVIAALIVACGAPEQVIVTQIVETIKEVEVPGETVVEEVVVTQVVETVTEVEKEVVVTQIVEVVAEPEPSDRTGGWLDTIIFVQEPNQDAAIARLAAGDIDIFGDDVGGAAAVQAIADAGNIQSVTQYGLYDEIFFNPSVCSDENLLNPFNNTKIREAMNWAIDRDFVADELYGGLAVPKYTTIAEAGADRGRFAAEIRSIEAKYAYDLEQTREVVTTEMEAMGAELVDGVWNYNGEPIVLIGLIRTEDTRLEIGNYYANQLEELGFTVDRVERTSGELSPLWASGDPVECQWNWYTGAWSATAISRDNGSNFDFFYTPRGLSLPAWQAFEPTERFDELSLRLNDNDFADLDERQALYAEILPLAAEMSTRVWVTSRTTLVPYSDQVAVTSDLAAGVSGAPMWAKTARFIGQEGGTMKIALPTVFVEPYNPIGGSNWVMDSMIKNTAGERALYADPNTGLLIPNRAERAEVVVQEGFPTGVTLDWVELSFEPEIVVPDDAWAGWDAENQVFLTAGEVYTETQTSVYKSTIYYPEDMFDTITWHDGSPITIGDFVLAMITVFDLGDEASANYDPSLTANLSQFLSSFKGVRIISENPLVIEHYADNAQLDAENSVVSWWPGVPTYDFGDAAWHNMALMLRADAEGGVVFTDDKANVNETERINMIAGPSLEILGGELLSATEEAYLPYAPTMSQYVSADEITQRYDNLTQFVSRNGHYYLGTGVYFFQGVFPVESQAVFERYEPHPDAANRWDRFSAAAIAEVEVDGDSRVTIGDEAVFEIFVDNVATGEAYAAADISGVTYLLFDATGAQVGTGQAEAVEDGIWEVVLDGETTGAMAEGASRIEVVVVSDLVALPSLGSFEFVTTP